MIVADLFLQLYFTSHVVVDMHGYFANKLMNCLCVLLYNGIDVFKKTNSFHELTCDATSFNFIYKAIKVFRKMQDVAMVLSLEEIKVKFTFYSQPMGQRRLTSLVQ